MLATSQQCLPRLNNACIADQRLLSTSPLFETRPVPTYSAANDALQLLLPKDGQKKGSQSWYNHPKEATQICLGNMICWQNLTQHLAYTLRYLLYLVYR